MHSATLRTIHRAPWRPTAFPGSPFLRFALALVWSVSLGCSAPESDEGSGRRCSTAEDCPIDFACTPRGVCVPAAGAPCSAREPCPAGYRCNEGNACEAVRPPDAPDICDRSSDCATVEICLAGRCRRMECTGDPDCPIDAACVGTLCRAALPCSSDEGCADGSSCVRDRCHPGCVDNAACGGTTATRCQDNRCVDTCSGDDVCPPGSRCIDSVCTPDECTGFEIESCPPGQRCNGAGRCVDLVLCDSSSQCAEGERCEEGVCESRIRCRADIDCDAADGQYCLDGGCIVAPPCRVAVQRCLTAEYCIEGWCIPGGCAEDRECRTGERCDAGRCLTRTAPTVETLRLVPLDVASPSRDTPARLLLLGFDLDGQPVGGPLPPSRVRVDPPGALRIVTAANSDEIAVYTGDTPGEAVLTVELVDNPTISAGLPLIPRLSDGEENLTIIVHEAGTLRPIADATVRFGGLSRQTNAGGVARFPLSETSASPKEDDPDHSNLPVASDTGSSPAGSATQAPSQPDEPGPTASGTDPSDQATDIPPSAPSETDAPVTDPPRSEAPGTDTSDPGESTAEGSDPLPGSTEPGPVPLPDVLVVSVEAPGHAPAVFVMPPGNLRALPLFPDDRSGSTVTGRHLLPEPGPEWLDGRGAISLVSFAPDLGTITPESLFGPPMSLDRDLPLLGDADFRVPSGLTLEVDFLSIGSLRERFEIRSPAAPHLLVTHGSSFRSEALLDLFRADRAFGEVELVHMALPVLVNTSPSIAWTPRTSPDTAPLVLSLERSVVVRHLVHLPAASAAGDAPPSERWFALTIDEHPLFGWVPVGISPAESEAAFWLSSTGIPTRMLGRHRRVLVLAFEDTPTAEGEHRVRGLSQRVASGQRTADLRDHSWMQEEALPEWDAGQRTLRVRTANRPDGARATLIDASERRVDVWWLAPAELVQLADVLQRLGIPTGALTVSGVVAWSGSNSINEERLRGARGGLSRWGEDAGAFISRVPRQGAFEPGSTDR